ncbi:response regulator [Desulfonatronum thiodismutans]|uniref:response regulator n=1 Tax=Desulfonatronum thiodismutans TaxID=159290 RepID=UPI00068ACDD5|nr:response regulator [Desulfonatronum thiodismutans]
MQTILIVDDDPDFLTVARKILAPTMCRLLIADSGAETLEIAAREQPDLILLDVSLPDIEGLELCRRIKADPDMGRSHVLFVSGTMTDPENQAQALRAGGSGFMTKPVNPQFFLAQVQATLRIKRSEDALRLEHAQVLSIFDSMGQYAYVVDPQSYKILFANKAMQAAYGRTLEGQTCYDVLQLEDRPCSFCGNSFLLQNPNQTHQKEHKSPVLGQHLLITEKVIKWPDGRDVIFKFGMDVTERIKAENALRYSQERFQLAMDATRDGLWDWNLETDEIYFSPAYTAMLGYAPGEIAPSVQFWSDNVHPDDLPLAWERITDCLENRLKNFEVEFRMRTKAGDWLWIQGRGSAVSRDKAGKAARMVGTHVDISERKAIEGRLQEAMRRAEAANQAKSAFLANMSHEIRTPMNGVIGLSRLLLDTPLTDEQRDLTGTILSSAEILLGLINDILDLSKVESGKLELEAIPFNLAQLLDELTSIMSHRARGKRLSLSCSTNPDVPPSLLGDPLRLRQILINLVENALKFTDQGGVLVTVERVEGNAGMLEYWDAGIGEEPSTARLRFTVRDTGVGIPQEMLAGVFEKFQQVDASSTRKYGGSGLGLAICKQLVELMGGEMGVESRVGQGSEFWFVVPLAVQDQKSLEAGPSNQGHASPSTGYPRFVGRVLLVEDSQVNQTVALGILKKLGLQAAVASNGLEALKALEQNDYDLVLMDVQMPGMDGLEATRRIRRQESEDRTQKPEVGDRSSEPQVSGFSPRPFYRRLPIIAMTAGAMQEDRDRSKEAGMDDHLTKPIDPRSLCNALARWLPEQEQDS